MEKDCKAYGSPQDAPALSGPKQKVRKGVLAIAVLLAVAFLVIGDSRWPNQGWAHNTIEWFGIGLILFCIVGRTWCAIYIGGRKNRNLVSAGPYSVCRNPLYLFSILGAIGIGAQVGSLVAALGCGFITWSVLLLTVWREEAALARTFGESYQRYLRRVPRFLPKFSLWRAPANVVVEPRIILVTFFDALFFVAAIPLAEGFEYLHDTGILPVLLKLA